MRVQVAIARYDGTQNERSIRGLFLQFVQNRRTSSKIKGLQNDRLIFKTSENRPNLSICTKTEVVSNHTGKRAENQEVFKTNTLGYFCGVCFFLMFQTADCKFLIGMPVTLGARGHETMTSNGCNG